MDANPTNSATLPGVASPGAGAPPAGGAANARPQKHGAGSAVKDCECVLCSAQRDKWRKKRSGGGPAPVATPGASVPAAQAVASSQAPPLLDKPPVPWIAADLSDVAGDLVSVVEALDIQSLKELAKDVSPDALQLVSERAAWNPTLKPRLQSSLAGVGAKYLNKSSVSAENKDEVILAGALTAVLYGSWKLRQDLKAMAEGKKPEKPSESSRSSAPDLARVPSNYERAEADRRTDQFLPPPPQPYQFTPTVNTKEPHS